MDWLSWNWLVVADIGLKLLHDLGIGFGGGRVTPLVDVIHCLLPHAMLNCGGGGAVPEVVIVILILMADSAYPVWV